MIVAKWSAKIFRADAQKVAEEILAIGNEVTPRQIVERAKDESTELHKCFTWDDQAAAEKYRLYEARQVIRLLVVDDQEVGTEPVRAFFKLDRSHDSGYKPTIEILRNNDEYQALLRQAKRELIIFEQKYKRLAELEGVFEEIKKII